MSRYRFFAWVFLLYFAVLFAGPAGAQEPTAIGVVEAFHQSLLEVMKGAKALGVKGRYKKLASRIERSFHLPLMIQVATSSHWRKADNEQVDKLVAAFTHLSISTYASQFDGYSGQAFETRGEKPGPQKTTLVTTWIVEPDSKPVELIYVTRKIKGEWRIVDVLVDSGISQLAVRRSEYRRVLKTKGIDGLIDTLNAKADQLLNE